MSKVPTLSSRQFYGRRYGRPLRSKLRSLVETLLPKVRLDLPGEADQIGAAEQTPVDRMPERKSSGEASAFLDLDAVFGRDAASGKAAPSEKWLEIGFGGGEHLAWQAERHPDIGFVGAEYFFNGIASLLRHIDDRGLHNLRIYDGDVRDLLPRLADGAIARVFILFPDPWPKSRHNKRRLVQDETLDELARVMADDAELLLATDDPDYLSWMLEHLVRRRDFSWTARNAQDWRDSPDDWQETRYERKAIEAGRQTAHLRFRRLPRTG
jgi:tRNA (guanine-N7-)-methyltransferase